MKMGRAHEDDPLVKRCSVARARYRVVSQPPVFEKKSVELPVSEYVALGPKKEEFRP
jgi:hypothetical protein